MHSLDDICRINQINFGGNPYVPYRSAWLPLYEANKRSGDGLVRVCLPNDPLCAVVGWDGFQAGMDGGTLEPVSDEDMRWLLDQRLPVEQWFQVLHTRRLLNNG